MTLGGAADAQQEVLRAACSGELLLDEAEALSGLLEARWQSLETQEMEARLSELNWRANASHGFK
ncbi:MAG: hypothetical protein EXR09_08450 [Acetobacteraceae bacterium]|nr:hypothetical protein [Acetobacteraceae bacterium]